MNTKTESIERLNVDLASEPRDNRSRLKPVIATVLTLWFGVVTLLGVAGVFTRAPGLPPLPIFFGFAIPLAAFFAAYFGISAFRDFVLRADLRFAAAIQAWRWAGLGFLSLFSYGILPGLFAFPAGLGDMAIGFTAPWILLGLIREPSFASSRRFVIWNIMGIADLVIAVTMGTLCSGFIPGLTSVTTSPMSQFPLVLIPAYLVPIFIMLHFTALVQARQLAPAGSTAKSSH